MLNSLKKLLIISSSICLAGLVSPACSAAQSKPIVMKLAHILNPGSPRDRLFHLYGENLAKATGGRIKVQVYPNAQLGNNEQIIQGVQSGAIQGTMTPTAFLSGFEPLLSVLDLPMLFKSAAESSEVANGAVGDKLIDLVKSKGVVGLAFYGEGAKNMVTNFPFNNLSDLKGKRIRSMPNPVMLKQFRIWGANPVPIGIPELYNALQNGTVLGQEQEWGIVRDLKYYEVSKYLTDTAHGMFVDFFFVSKTWYDKLPADLQKEVVGQAKKLIPVFLSWQNKYNDDALADMRKDKSVVYKEPSPALAKEFAAQSKPVYKWFIDQYGDQAKVLFDTIQGQLKQIRSSKK